MNRLLADIAILATAAGLTSCAGGAASASDAASARNDDSARSTASASPFDADSAYANVARQVEFGPRVPGSDGHSRCGRWLVAELRRHGADTIIEQNCTATAYDGTRLNLTNIMARYNPGARRRLLLAAHWDTRHIADRESDPARRAMPIDGANDGASGVGVLLEVARLLGSGELNPGAGVGVDILLVDGEDYGAPEDVEAGEDTWCLGTQYWAGHTPYTSEERVEGIVLDMVGGRDAVFTREALSEYFAPELNMRVWSTASRLGLGERFVADVGGAVTDDHLYINRAGIPCVNIIEASHPATGSFNPAWHTLDDTLDGIDPATLGDVGTVVTEFVKTYNQ